jgi:hypothetical protein
MKYVPKKVPLVEQPGVPLNVSLSSPDFEPVRLMVHRDQKRALERASRQRGKPMQVLLREAIQTLTGVPDPNPPNRYRPRKRKT